MERWLLGAARQERKVGMRKRAGLWFLLPLWLCWLALGASASGAGREGEILYFYENLCASCNAEGAFYDLFNSQVGDIKNQVSLTFRLYDTFSFGDEAFQETCEELGIPQKERQAPLLVMDGLYLMGEDAIAAGLRQTFCEAYGLPYTPLEGTAGSPAGEGDLSGTPAGEEAAPGWGKPYLLYYYTAACEDCRQAAGALDTLAARFPDAVIDRRSLLEGDNVLQIRQLFEEFAVPSQQRKAPIVFYQEGYLAGAEEIERLAAATVRSGAADYGGFAGQGAAGAGPSLQSVTPSQLLPVLAAGLINGLNPCAISMVLLLVSVLLLEKRRLLSLGLTYIAAKGVTYFVISFGLYAALSLLESRLFGAVSRFIQIAAALLMLTIAAFSLWDFFACRREDYGRVRLQLPSLVRAFCSRTIERLRSPRARGGMYLGVAAVSVVVSAGEFLCTGQVALATLLYLVQSAGRVDGMSAVALILYVLAMLLPLTALILLLHSGQRVFTMSEWVRRRMPLIKLLGALLFTAFACYMLLTL
jgi:hypothetical protein